MAKTKEFLIKYWEKAGPKQVEDRFVEAFRTVQASLPDEEARKAYEQTEKTWRKAGKIAGVAATVVDFGLVGLNIKKATHDLRWKYSKQNRLHYQIIDARRNQDNGIKRLRFHLLFELYTAIYGHEPAEFSMNENYIHSGGFVEDTPRLLLGDRLYASTPLLKSLAILAGLRPAHALAHLAARGAETVGKMQAKSANKKSNDTPPAPPPLPHGLFSDALRYQ